MCVIPQSSTLKDNVVSTLDWFMICNNAMWISTNYICTKLLYLVTRALIYMSNSITVVMTKIYRMINRYLSQKCTSVNLFPKHNKWILSVYNLIIFSNFPQIKSALDEQLKCLVLKVSVEDILLWLSMHLKNIRFTKRMRANDLKEIWNIFRHYNLKQISYFTTLIRYTLCNVIQNY